MPSWPSGISWPYGLNFPSVTPPGLLPSVTVVGWWRSDLGVNRTGSVVDSWTNQVAGGPAWTATGTARPTYLANDGAFAGRPSLAWEVTDDQMVTTLAAPAPGTTSRYYLLVAQNLGLAAGTGTLISGDGGTSHLILRNGADAASQLSMYSGTFQQGASNFPLSGAARTIQAGFTNSTADFLKIGASNTTGTSSGNGSAASMRLGAFSAGAGFGNKKIVEVLIANGSPTASERAALESYTAALYGATVMA